MSLVGVGPGDPGLLTLRGKQAIERADTVLHDALIHPRVLRHARPEAEVLFVGKRKGVDSATQDEINHMLLFRARQGRRVARLKGGDPLLFARGAEEAEFLAAHGVAFEIIAGVTSALGVAAYAGIPLSHRDLASSVTFATATERAGKDSGLQRLSEPSGTLALYMGLHQLDAIAQSLIAGGRAAETPAAVVQWGTCSEQRVVVGTLRDIHARCEAEGIGAPALVVVGEVVRLREKLRWFDRGPLFGRRVLVTRPRAQAEGFVSALIDAGAVAIEVPAIAFEPPSDPAPLARCVEILGTYDAVAFTSANGVERLFDAMAERGLDARALGRAKVVAIGPATAEALKTRGIRPDAVPREHIGEALAESIAALFDGALTGRRVLVARAEVAREALPQRLREAGAEVEVVAVYRTVPAPVEAVAALREALMQRAIDVVTFTSSSTVHSLCDALGGDAAELLAGLQVCSIGPITSQAARERGLAVTIEATEYTAEGMLRALSDHFGAQ